MRDPKNAVTLGEGWTPLVRADRLAKAVGCANLWIKDEGRNPSGTFKDRGAAVALSRYRELGVNTVALNSSGNAGGSWALYAARAGIACVNVLPPDAQPSSRRQCELGGARTYYAVNWHDAGKIVADACAKQRLVQRVHAERALSHRRQEDDGARDRGAARLAPAGRRRLPDGRGPGRDRDLESVRGAARARAG